MFHFTGRLSGGKKKPIPSRSHAGAQRATRAQNYHVHDPADFEEELPPPPIGIPGGFRQQANNHSENTAPDIGKILGSVLGGDSGGSVPGLGGLNLGSILGMLGR
jgi:hypothetical protein